MKKTFIALAILSTLSIGALAFYTDKTENTTGNSFVTSVEDNRFERRAIEAGTWIIPQVLYSAKADNTIAALGGERNNTIYYHSGDVTWHTQVSTGNNNAPYVFLYQDLTNGPVVVEIPAATESNSFFGTFLDSWHKPYVDVGPGGVDAGEGGKYLLVGPNFEGDIPEGYIVIRQETNQGYMALRSVMEGTTAKHFQGSDAYIRTIKAYPLGAESTETDFRMLDHIEITKRIEFNSEFFERANKRIQEEVIKQDEKAMYGMLKMIGIEKGTEFINDSRFEDIAAIIHEEVIYDYINYAPRLHPESDSLWTIPVNIEMMRTNATYVSENWNDMSGRGTTFAFYFAPPASLANSTSTAYFKGTLDSDGNRLNGSNDYKLTMHHNTVPAAQFYSMLTYDLHTSAYIKNVEQLGIASNAHDFVVNKDGTIDFHWSSNCAEKQYANCMDTKDGDEWFSLFRLYSPTSGLFDGSFSIPNIKLIK